MNIKQIKSIVRSAADVPVVLDRVEIPFVKIGQVNWPDSFPYKPDVEFRMAYNDLSLLLHFRVRELIVRAVYGKDNGQVWTDSCVEFFSVPAGDGIYYNLECNCIGTVLLAAGPHRENREHAGPDTLGSIQRWASLGRAPFEEKAAPVLWEVALIVPYTAFFKHRIRSVRGKTIKANFYKCGDELRTPHFLSWNPIRLEKPNFHCPEFFGELTFD
ncbi:MAG: hypothetical protein ILA34_08170 [Bacteroidaceae bacterium]|nr:hypothetical protein [Bacteroidaceae bacterium]